VTNKIFISILIIFLLIVGGLGYSSYNLNRQLDRLDEKLTVLETGQTARINTLSDEIGSLREETQNNFETIQGQLEKNNSEISALSEKMTAADIRIAGIEDKTNSLSTNITDLAGRIKNSEKDLSGSIINANAIFENISRVTVMITDGTNGIGTGFIYDTEGHVVTAYHVIKELSPIYVIMNDGKVSYATITGYSEFSDIGVLKLENSPSIEPPPIADSSLIKIGEPVIAIGNPLGFRDTLTAGRISQVNRYTNYTTDTNWIANLLQFDAAVNPGNSGGPLINSSGEIVGVVVARINTSEGDGIYWAVASNKFKRVADTIITGGSFPYPWIGVGIRDISPQEATEKALETINGVFVSDVISGSPGQAAGIRAGDIILSIDSTPVKDIDELVSYLGEFKSPGQAVLLSIIRGIEKMDISVIVGTRPQ
jgi:S1-C subfamily serine protease